MTDPTNDGTTPPPPPTPGGYSQPGGYNQPGGYSQQPGGYAQQPGAYAAPGGYAQAGYGSPAPTKTLSLIGMILGIVGIVFNFFYGAGFLFSIAAIVLGHLGKKREGLPAKGFWLTALITGYVGIALAVLVIVGVVIFFAFLAAGAGAATTYNY